MKYINIIKSFYPSLSKGEKKVADYVLEAKEDIIYQTLQEIAKKINVGEATIVRFCKKIGFDGFNILKLSIAKEKPLNINIDEDDNFISSVTKNIYMSISNTNQILDIDKLDKVVHLINSSDSIFLYGVGSSANACMDMQSRLLRYGKVSNVVLDTHFQLMTSSIISKNALLIVFSLSGYTNEIKEAVKIAKDNNVSVVAITNHAISPIAELADVVLLSAGRESPLDGGSLSGRVSQLYIIDIICTGYALLDRENTTIMKEKTANSVLSRSLEYKNK